MVSESALQLNDIVRNLVEFTRSNPDCHAPAILENVLAFLREVAEASDGVRECERRALLEVEKAFAPQKGRLEAAATVAKRRLRFRHSAIEG